MKTLRPQPPQERGASWLSDLLARASVDDVEPDPAPPGEGLAVQPEAEPAAENPLQALSFDVMHLVDNEGLIDAWDRFRRGERGVFTRRIYTPAGQQTFEEIRRRCRSDLDFRDTVNRYTQEFERLLRDAAATDRDGSVVHTYLTSETGKVYTILAHAAGRLD